MDIEPSLASTSRFQKFRLLLWKNFLWHRYYWWWTIIELLARSIIPLFIGYSAVRGDMFKPILKPETFNPAVGRMELLETIPRNYRYISYTPSTPFTDQLMKNVMRVVVAVNQSVKMNLVTTSDESELELFTLKRSITNHESPFGIVFLGVTPNDGRVPSTLVYKLRHGYLFNAKFMYQLWPYSPGPYQAPLKWRNYLRAEYNFWSDGISAVQLVLNEEFVRMRMNSSSWSVPQPFFQSFPYPKYEGNRESREEALFHLIYIYIAFDTFLVVPFLASVINEKRNGSKELMIIYGMEEWMIWLCWFIKAFIIHFISITLMTVFFYVPLRGPRSEVINFVSFSVVWVTFLMFEAAILSFLLFFGAIFDRATIASITFLFVTYFAYIAMLIVNLFHLEALVLNLFPMRNLLYGFSLIRFSEMHGVNASLTSIKDLKLDDSTYKTHIFFFTADAVDIIVYAILAILINKKVFSRIKSRLFSFKSIFSRREDEDESLQKVYLSGINKIVQKTDDLVSQINKLGSHILIEASSRSENEPLIRIEDLQASYGNTQALKGIDLEFHENEINVLLGHKGAGKSTLFSILTESIPFDQGSIQYKGADVTSNMNMVKSNVGIGFKADGLFHHLSVMQHLIFYGMLKGLSKNDAVEQAENFLTRMDMQEESKSATKKLSTAAKKKLSIGIALIGEREDMRSNRTVILTSNYEKEAEIFADHITVMENGVVIAHGTRDFIKQQIGNDYELLISGKTLDSSKVSDTVFYNVDAAVERETDQDIVYKVPASESYKFRDLFESLENNGDSLGISTVNITPNTIQDVLMKNGTLSDHESVVSPRTAEILREDPSASTGGFGLRLKQIGVLFKRRIVILKRDYVTILIRIVIPSVVVLLFVRIIEIFDFNPFPLVKLSPNMYIRPKFMFHNNTPSPDLIKLYSDYLQPQSVSIYTSKNSTFVGSLIEYGKKDITSYRRELLAGFEIEGMKTKGILYNLFGKYTLPIAITVYSNVLLKSATKDKSSEIITYNHPLPIFSDWELCAQNEKIFRVFTYFFLLFFAFGYLLNEVIMYLFEFTNQEVANGLMHLEIMSGVPKWIYWFTNFVFDFLFFIFVVAFRVGLFMLFDNFINFFNFDAQFGLFLVLVLIYGITGLFCSYIVSNFYKPVKRTYGHLFLFNIACNVVGILLLFMRNTILFQNVIARTSPLVSVVLCIPFVNYLYTIQNYFITWYNNNQCFFFCLPIAVDECLERSPPQPYLEFAHDDNEYGIMLELVFLICTLICSVVLFLLMNFGVLDLFHNVLKKSKLEYHPDDDNVVEERVEIQLAKEDESRYRQVPLMVDGLGKNYIKLFGPTTVVDDVSFIAQRDSCFGILGQDAGKTTTFGMMAAQIRPTKGNVSVEGVTMRGERKQYFSVVSYCPQSSPLLDKFTGKEMLMLIASLKGINDDIGSVVDELISSTGLNDIQHLKCESYSDGKKRVLGTVLALIGNPNVIYLDEPANDIDSESRRHIYDIIEQVKQSGKIVVLGSKSSKECELLCDRITMLVNSAMHCIGNPQDLKNLFNLGYFIMIKVNPDPSFSRDLAYLEKNMIRSFGSESCRLIADYKGLMHYLITAHSLPLSGVFETMENIKQQNSVIEDYMISTTTLDNIFDSLTHSKELFRSASFH